jgi:hypothetical protein
MNELYYELNKLSGVIHSRINSIKDLDAEKKSAQSEVLKEAYATIRKQKVLEILNAINEFWNNAPLEARKIEELS